MPAPSPTEKPVLLRIPENYIIALDTIVERSKGQFKSRNDLVIDIIGTFLSDLRSEADSKHG